MTSNMRITNNGDSIEMLINLRSNKHITFGESLLVDEMIRDCLIALKGVCHMNLSTTLSHMSERVDDKKSITKYVTACDRIIVEER